MTYEEQYFAARQFIRQWDQSTHTGLWATARAAFQVQHGAESGTVFDDALSDVMEDWGQTLASELGGAGEEEPELSPAEEARIQAAELEFEDWQTYRGMVGL